MNTGEINSYLLNSRCKDKWQLVGTKRRAGVAVPLFSLYSKNSSGIGELTDLNLLADWCLKTGISIIQLLPLNDVGSDFAPYNSVSSFALDPMYLNLNDLSYTETAELSQKTGTLRKKFRPAFRKVNYKVKQAKLELLWHIYRETNTDEITDYILYKKNNQYWLNDYSVYKVIAELNPGIWWVNWDEDLKTGSMKLLQRLKSLIMNGSSSINGYSGSCLNSSEKLSRK